MISRRKFVGGMALGLIAGRSIAANTIEFDVSETVADIDHGDPAQTGSIAWALAQANVRGGVVRLGSGVFNTNSAIRVNSNVQLIGSGISTQIRQWNNNSHGVSVDGRDLAVRDFSVSLPTSSSGGYAGVAFGSEGVAQSGFASNLKVTGGNLASWGFIVDQHYNFMFTGLLLDSKPLHLPSVNGMLIHNSKNSYNTGDSTYTAIKFRIKSSAIGMKMISDNVGKRTGSINGITFSNVQVIGNNDGGEQGFVLENTTTRNTFINCDSEACDINWYIKGKNCTKNVFINSHAWTGTRLISVPTINANTFIGGNLLEEI